MTFINNIKGKNNVEKNNKNNKESEVSVWNMESV